jgi:hypothetical protein
VANESDNYFWFYIKNFGLIALLAPVAFIAAKKEDRGVVGGGLLIWIIAEFIQSSRTPMTTTSCFSSRCVLLRAGRRLAGRYGTTGSCAAPARNRISIAVLAAMVCVVLFLSGALTLGREYVSEYQLIDRNEVQAAEYVKENAAPDATFLTSNNHNNCIAALTGTKHRLRVGVLSLLPRRGLFRAGSRASAAL